MASLNAVALMNVAVRERVATATGRIVEHLGIEPIQPLERKIKADDRVRVIRESEQVAAFLERIADALDGAVEVDEDRLAAVEMFSGDDEDDGEDSA